MQLALLDSIIRILSDILLSNKCCKDFVPTQGMLNNFTPERVYAKVQNPDQDSTEDIEQLL